jgi:hypothetical protein
MTAAKLVIEVQAGVILGEPDLELTKRWVVTSEDWEAATPGDDAAGHPDGGGVGVCRVVGSAAE